jgi:hypothetical protein
MIGVLRSETADGIRQLQIQLSAGKIPTSAKLVKIIWRTDYPKDAMPDRNEGTPA